MPTLTLRSIGMSFAIEGVGACGLDGEGLFEALQSWHGLAAAAVGTPVETVLIDRKAETWDSLMAWLESWVRAQGASDLCWTRQEEDAAEPGLATLEFEV